MTHLHASWFVTLVFESKADSFDSREFTRIRRADAAAIGVDVEIYESAPIREGAAGPDLATLIRHEGPIPESFVLSPAGTTEIRIGSYVHLREVVGSVPLESAPSASGLLLGLTDCADRARLDEFHRFYDENHAADVVRSPFYERGDRYTRVDGDLGEFLALYSGAIGEPAAFRGYLAWPERDRTRSEVFVVRTVGTFTRIG